MRVPKTTKTKARPMNDPKLAGINEITSLFIERIAAESVIGEIQICESKSY
jgi:hypothetical protein